MNAKATGATTRTEIVCTPTRERALEIAKPYLSEKYEAYRAWGQDAVLPQDETFDLPVDRQPGSRPRVRRENGAVRRWVMVSLRLGPHPWPQRGLSSGRGSGACGRGGDCCALPRTRTV